MNSVAIKTTDLKDAVKLSNIKTKVKLTTAKNTSVSLTDDNKDLLEYMHDNFRLTSAQKTKINNFLSDCNSNK